jgi:phosphatidate cytidylyltransferase
VPGSAASRNRLATAAVLAPALWIAIRFAPPVVFHGLTLIVVAIAAWECVRILEAAGHRPLSGLAVAAAVATAATFSTGVDLALVIVCVGAAAFGAVMMLREEPRAMLESLLSTTFPVLFVGLALGFLSALRSVPGEDGRDLLLLLFVCVILSDTAAYYVGKALGRHPLAPRLSPKKSWEGAFAGLAASIAGGVLAHLWFYRRLPLAHAMALGAILGLAAIAGDLAESMVKRATGVKDSSGLLPGHGGLLDRTDSLLFSAPLLFYYHRALLEGPP